MKTVQGRQIAILSASLAVCVLAIFCFSARNSILEHWYLFRFRHGAPSKRSEIAAELVRLQSRRVIQPLVHLMDCVDNFQSIDPWIPQTLGGLGSRARQAIPALAEALKDRRLAIHAIEALGQMGSAAQAMVPALLELQHQPEYRIVVTEALERMR